MQYCLAVVVVFGLLGPARPAAAQPAVPRVLLSAGQHYAFLGEGDHEGQLSFGRLTLQPSPRAALVLEGGYLTSVDRDLEADAAGTWRDRTHTAADVLLQLDLVRLRGGAGVLHRGVVRMGASLRHRREERAFALLGPLLVQAELDRGRTLADLQADYEADALYAFEEDGLPYALATRREEATEAGGAFSVGYLLHVQRFALGIEAGYRGYQKGSPVMHYGASLGLGW